MVYYLIATLSAGCCPEGLDAGTDKITFAFHTSLASGVTNDADLQVGDSSELVLMAR